MSDLYSANLAAITVVFPGGSIDEGIALLTVPPGHRYVILSMDANNVGGDAGDVLVVSRSDLRPATGGVIISQTIDDIGNFTYRGRLTLNAGVSLIANDNRGDGWGWSIDGYDLLTP